MVDGSDGRFFSVLFHCYKDKNETQWIMLFYAKSTVWFNDLFSFSKVFVIRKKKIERDFYKTKKTVLFPEKIFGNEKPKCQSSSSQTI